MSVHYQYSQPTAWCEINTKALRHNYRAIRTLALKQADPYLREKVRLLSVVKAEAYGHGMIDVARVLQKDGCEFFAVSNVEEGVALRRAGIKGTILLFETCDPAAAREIVKNALVASVADLGLARALDREARRVRKAAEIHVEAVYAAGSSSKCRGKLR